MHSLYEEVLIALHSVWKRRWLALAIGWGVALAGWVVVSLVPNTYESQARVLVKVQSLLPNQPGAAADRAQTVDQIRQTLTSQPALERVVRETDLAKQVANDRDVADRAAALVKQITVRAEQDNLFLISAQSGDRGLSNSENAAVARQITQKLVALFVDGSLASSARATGASLEFLDAQIAERGRQLAAAEAKRAAFEQKYMALLPGAGTVADRIAATRSEIVRIEGDIGSARSSLNALNAQLAAVPASTRTPGAIIDSGGGNATAIAQVQAQIADGQARGWTEAHPDMIALKGQLVRLRAVGGGGTTVGAGTVTPNPAYVSLRSMQAEKLALVSSLEARRGQLQAQINGVIASQAANPQIAAEQTEIDRAYSVLKAQYDKLLADREDVKLRSEVQTADTGKFTVIDPPSTPRVPATPNRPLLLSLVLVAALAAGAGTAFILGQLQHSFPTASRLARASGMPVLGAIRQVVPASALPLRARRLTLFAGGAAALVGLWALLMVVEFIQRATVA